MRILFVNTVCGRTSTANIINSILKYQKESGNDCLFCYGRGKKIKEKEFLKISTCFETALDGLLSRVLDNQGFNSKKATNRLINAIEEFKPDIINIHNMHGYYLNIEHLINYLSLNYKGKVVFTLHDTWTFTGHCCHYKQINCEKWKTHCKKCILKNTYPKSFLKDNSYNNFCKKSSLFSNLDLNKVSFVVPSYWLANEIKQSPILSRFPCYVINNGIHTEDCAKAKQLYKKVAKKDNGQIKLLASSMYWTKEKGIYDLIELSKMLPSSYSLKIIGDIKAKITKNDLKNITIEHSVDRKELFKELASADVFLNPTHCDTYPTINIESICCGTPVITYDVCGSKETIKKSQYGLAIEPNVNSLLNAISSYFNNNSVNFDVDYSLYSVVKMQEKYNKLFVDILGTSR